VDLPDRLAAERERRRRGRHRLLRVARVLGDVPLHERERAVRSVALHDRVLRVAREEDDLARAVARHRDRQRVGGVEHRVAMRAHVLDEHALDRGAFLDRVDAVEAEVIAIAHVGHDRDVAAIPSPSDSSPTTHRSGNGIQKAQLQLEYASTAPREHSKHGRHLTRFPA